MNQASSPPHPTATQGFTLLEVLVALVILGIGVAALSGAISTSLRGAERINQENHAVTFADSLLAQLGLDLPLRPGTTAGTQGTLRWTLNIQPTGQNNIDAIDLIITTPTGRPIGHWQTLRIAPP